MKNALYSPCILKENLPSSDDFFKYFLRLWIYFVSMQRVLALLKHALILDDGYVFVACLQH